MSKKGNDINYLLRFRLWLIIPFVITGILLLIALLSSKEGIMSQFELTVSRVSFVILDDNYQLLSESPGVKSAQIVHFDSLRISFGEAQVADDFDDNSFYPTSWKKCAENRKMSIIPINNFSSINFDNVRLGELRIEEQAQIAIGVPDDNNDLVSVVIRGYSPEGKIDIKDTAVIQYQNCNIYGLEQYQDPELAYFRLINNTSQKLDFRGRERQLALYLEPTTDMKLIEHTMSVAQIEFIKGQGNQLQTSIRLPSSIILNDFNDRKIEVKDYEYINIDDSANLYIHKLDIVNGEIKLVMSGEVNALLIGTTNNMTSRLPSALEWIYEWKPLYLYINAFSLVFTTIIAILQRLKFIPQKTEVK